MDNNFVLFLAELLKLFLHEDFPYTADTRKDG